MDERIGFGLYQSCGNRGVLNVCVFGCGGVGGVGGEWVGGLDQGLEGWGVGRVCFGCGGVGGVGGEWVWGLDQGLEGWGGVMSV